ncbi:hypothetical protein Taro_001913 [Colocasia esculenta]|uniref:aldehyde oxygenase (deformylating) n=1 Tax=Colocasia esculenta TaxID=4460 RepID=A0A843TJG9_COLES|nr:hypothetical protein [Colocasia esculenta]
MAWGGVSDELLPVILPVAAYWTTSGFYQVMLMRSGTKHRLFTSEEESARNLVSRRQVFVRVLQHQTMQMTLAAAVFMGAGGKGTTAASIAAEKVWPPLTASLLQMARQVAVAMLFIDAWQYSWHRLTHTSKFLYKHVHSFHHRMVVPYAYGAQYFHPVDAFVGEIVGGVLSTVVSGMPPRTAAVFFSVLTIKGVDDHCGLWFPNHPFHRFLCNNSAFHAFHHQHEGIKYNFSAYFFANWDKLLGTYMPYSVLERKGGGYELRAAKDN